MRCVGKAKWRSWRGSFASLLLYDMIFVYIPSDHLSEVARAGAVRCSCALFNELSHASFIGASTAVLSKLPHSNCCERVPSRPLRGRRGRFPWPLGQGALKV